MATKKVTRKKVVKQPESTWFSKGIFYAMAGLCIASVLTACTMLFKGIDLGNYDSRPNATVAVDNTDDTFVSVVELQQETVVEPIPEVAPDGVTTAIEKIIDDKILTAMETHLREKHEFDGHSSLLKCHQLGSNTFSCKMLQGKPIEVEEEDKVEVEVEMKPTVPVVEEDVEPNKWNPFK